jgi:NTE family protein
MAAEFKDDERYRFKLRVIASDISNGRMLVLPQDIAEFGIRPEDLNIVSAIRMSMSIPFFYEPVRLKNMKTNQVSYIVDGGILSNFPVWLFDTEGAIPEWPTFGFKLVEPEEGAPHQVRGPISLLTALFSTMSEAHDARYIKDADFVRTIPIPTLDVRTTEFDLSPEKSEALYQSGRQAAEKFFDTWDFAKYVNKYRKGRPSVHRSPHLRSR